jgi:Protein kinase domain
VRKRIGRVAEAIGDGERVDWRALTRDSHPDDRKALDNLRTLATLTGLRPAGRPQPSLDADRRPLSLVWRALLLIAALQAACGTSFAAYALITRGATSVTLLIALSMVSLGASAVVLLIFGRDTRTGALAALLLLLASAASQPFLHNLSTTPVLGILALGMYPDAFLPFFAWTFTRDFPQVIRFSRLDDICRLGALVSLGCGAGLFAINLAIARLPELTGTVGLQVFQRGGTSLYWALVIGLMAAALVVMVGRRRQAGPAERTRVAFFLWSLAVGLLPLVIIVSLEELIPAFDRFTSEPAYAGAVNCVIYVSVLSIPFTTTYAVIVQRVLDVPVIVRRTIRRALARQSLMIMGAIPLALLGWELVVNRNRTIAEFLSGPQAVAALGCAGAILVLLAVRGPLLELIDRWYFRDDVNFAPRLVEFTESLSRARSRRQLGELANGLVAPLLQAEFADVWCRQPTDFVSLRGGGTPLKDGSALVAMLADGSGPLDLTQAQIERLLPDDDRQWIQSNRVSALVPLTREGTLHAVMVVGYRRSESGFSSDALLFLSTAAAAAALAQVRLERDLSAGALHAESPPPDPPATECRHCGLVAASDAIACSCGGDLRTAALPQLVAGKFWLEALIGRGGMGIVYRARDRALSRPVALKTLPQLTRRGAERLKTEAQRMAAVPHPALATIHAVEAWQGAPVLVLEFLAGGTLATRIDRGPLPWGDAVSMTLEIADGVRHLHSHNLLHRDIKPSNVGFTAAGHLKVLDFGLAQAFEDEDARAPGQPHEAGPMASHLAGTLTYLPPEGLRGVPPSPAFDLWAMAMVLYESVAGGHPFLRPGHNADTTVALVRQGVVPDVRSCCPDCPEPIAAFLRRSLQVRPSARPVDVESFVVDLTKAAELAGWTRRSARL